VKDRQSGSGMVGWAESNEIEIGSVEPGSGAERAGLKRDDILVSVNGQPIRSTPKLPDIINATSGKPVELEFKRDGQLHQVTVAPARKKDAEGWKIGVGIQTKRIITKLPLPEALAESVRENAKDASLIYTLLRGIVEHRMSAGSMMGPIGIAQVSGEAARGGVVPFVGLMAAVSLNLAVFNLLPIPILDGGVILLLLIEMFMRRDLSLRVKEAVFKVGFVFLMAVVAFVIYNDISKLAG
jgi:regulator of sigma E protease